MLLHLHKRHFQSEIWRPCFNAFGEEKKLRFYEKITFYSLDTDLFSVTSACSDFATPASHIGINAAIILLPTNI